MGRGEFRKRTLGKLEYSSQYRGVRLPRVNQGREMRWRDGKGVTGGGSEIRHNGLRSCVGWCIQCEIPGDNIAKITFQNISQKCDFKLFAV